MGLATQFQALHTRRAARPLHHSILWRAIQEKMSFALKKHKNILEFLLAWMVGCYNIYYVNVHMIFKLKIPDINTGCILT